MKSRFNDPAGTGEKTSRAVANHLHSARPRASVSLSSSRKSASSGETAQLLAATVTITGGDVTAASIGGSRPASNVRGTQGDHTTPYTMFESMAIHNVLGVSAETAVSNLKVAIERVKDLPGYENAGARVQGPIDTYYDRCIDFADDVSDPPTKQEIETLMEMLVTLRNAIPMTAYHNHPSTGGAGEAASVGGLDYAERKVRRGEWTQKSDFVGDPIRNVWDTFDWGAPGARLDNEGWGHVLEQHIRTVRDSFPHLFEIEAIYTMEDMKDYLVDNLLDIKFPNDGDAEEIADNIDV